VDDNYQQQLKIYPEVPLAITGNEEEDLYLNTLAFFKATAQLIN
jgi:hypothetical protein